MDNEVIIKYVPYTTTINPNFWFRLADVKLNVDRLKEERQHAWAYYTNVVKQCLPSLDLNCTSFNAEYTISKDILPCHGYIIIKNTIEQFRDCDKVKVLDDEGKFLYEKFQNGSIYEDPSQLNIFLMVSFADLKNHSFFYWFAFPTPSRFSVTFTRPSKPLSEYFSENETNQIIAKYFDLNVQQKSYFVIEMSESVQILTLKQYKEKSDSEKLVGHYYFAYSDCCTVGSLPGWAMRNYLAFLYYSCPNIRESLIKVISFCLYHDKNYYKCDNSKVFGVLFPPDNPNIEDVLFGNRTPGWIGWQRNLRDKLGPKFVDMSYSMDPKRLCETSVDLNLKLMKWRLLPDINLDLIKTRKFLILGAGTLGCSVARNLLAWGVRFITFVDNGKVSFSNPVRQSLYTYEDCVKNLPKAEAAANSLKKIFPSIISTGHRITIPMPNHSVGDSFLGDIKASVDKLTKLISEHDIIFLLTDSRESRWLPTVLSTYYNKTVINAALGFDTYVVIRHGVNSNEHQYIADNSGALKSIGGCDLGCYFCHDITAPGNSMKDRTLDQQCTVTRPGVSAIAGALAAELAISILQHPKGPEAPAFYSITANLDDLNVEDECMLGILPHSIRGFLSSYSQVLPATQRFLNCIACSKVVLDEYKENGFEFLLKVFNSSKHLEDITGLTHLYQESDPTAIWELASSSDSD